MVAVALAALAGSVTGLAPAGAAEFRFVAEGSAEDGGEGRTVWVPREVVIHRSTELQDGLAFMLENPTNRTHAFAAYGLFEEVMGAKGAAMRKPLRVNVTPEDTVLVQISTAQFEGPEGGGEGVEEFAFFCPLHKRHLGGTIRVTP